MLAAGTERKLTFWCIFYFDGVLPGTGTVKFFIWHFSVTYNVCFTKIICISMAHRLHVFSRIFSRNSIFLHLKNHEDQDNCNILLPVCFKHPVLQII